jgi:hypothetical protein
MNKIVYGKNAEEIIVSENIINANFDDSKTAFIGHLLPNEDDGDDRLFLVCYQCIIDAENPIDTWDVETKFSVAKWVDTQIIVGEKKE